VDSLFLPAASPLAGSQMKTDTPSSPTLNAHKPQWISKLYGQLSMDLKTMHISTLHCPFSLQATLCHELLIQTDSSDDKMCNIANSHKVGKSWLQLSFLCQAGQIQKTTAHALLMVFHMTK
jgi:hypothetical protein